MDEENLMVTERELMSNVEKRWQFPSFTISSILYFSNGCDSGTTILFISRKSIHSLSLRSYSFLKTSVTNFVIWNSISFSSGILHLCGFFDMYLFSVSLMEPILWFPSSHIKFMFGEYVFLFLCRLTYLFFCRWFRYPRSSVSMYSVTFTFLLWLFLLSSFLLNIISSLSPTFWATLKFLSCFNLNFLMASRLRIRSYVKLSSSTI